MSGETAPDEAAWKEEVRERAADGSEGWDELPWPNLLICREAGRFRGCGRSITPPAWSSIPEV